MQRISMTLTGLVIAFAVVSLAGCTQLGKQGATRSDRTDTFELRGIVVKKNLEGGFFAIEGDDGRVYDPINLPAHFKKDGLKVKMTAKLRNDMAGIHMIGDSIEIVDIAAE